MIEDLNPRTIAALADAIGAAVGGGGTNTQARMAAKITATLNTMVSAASTRSGRKTIIIQNAGTAIANVMPDDGSGFNAAYLKANGIILQIGGSITVDNDAAGWYGISELAALDLRVLEVYTP